MEKLVHRFFLTYKL